MPLHRPTFAPRRLRPATPNCGGGASSLLRLSQPATPRLPKGAELTDWIQRAVSAIGGRGEQMPAFAASEFLG
jgi:hypothetical protein